MADEVVGYKPMEEREEEVASGQEEAEVPTEDAPVEETAEERAAETYNGMVEKYGEKTGHKIEVTLKDREDELEKKRAALEKAQQAFDEAPVGKEEKEEAALAKAQEEYDVAKAERDEWAAVKEEYDRNNEVEEEVVEQPKESVEESQQSEEEQPIESREEEPAEEQTESYKLSNEIDENGRPFVVAEDGTTIFGEIREESGLQAAPIKLSQGFQGEDGKGYGLEHIEANHGQQIRDAGFASVEEFVSYVAKNYDEDNIRVGKRRKGGNTSYLIQVTDKYDNTLFIELSKDGSYWNVNSGGIFRKGYANKKETVAKTEPQQPNNAVSTDSSLSMDETSGITPTEPNGESTVSDGKDTKKNDTDQIKNVNSSVSAVSEEGKQPKTAEVEETESENSDVREHRAEGEDEEQSEWRKALGEGLDEVLGETKGEGYHTDLDEGQQRLLETGNKAQTMKGKKKTASETVKLNSPEGEQANVTDISDAESGAKVLKNIDTLAKKYEEKSNQPRNILKDIAEAIGAKSKGSVSKYATIKAKNGKIVTIRLSNHNAKVRNFDNNNEPEGMSIVVAGAPNNGINNNGKAHIVEYFYRSQDLRSADGKPLVDIIRSVEQMLYSGEYKDTTGLAQRQEVNAEDLKSDEPNYFRTPEGTVYGFTVDGEIYIDPRIATPETRVHEYAHLWAQGLKEKNPRGWEQLKSEMAKEADVIDYVKRLYPELFKDGVTDEGMEEVFAHYSGRRGAERLEREMQEEMAKANGVFEKAQVASVFAKIRDLLSKFWKMSRDLFAGKVRGIEKLKGEDFADMMLGDLLGHFDPGKKNKEWEAKRDREYMEAVERGDMEKAQRMVNDAARKAGYVSDADYRMHHTAPNGRDGFSKSIADPVGLYPEDLYSPNGARYYGDGNMWMDMASAAIFRRVHHDPEAMVKIYRAVPKDSKESKLRNGDWVSINRQYAKEHGERVIDGGYKIIEDEVPAKYVYTDANSLHEQGYDDGRDYAYQNTKNNRKLLDAVTYDDEGNVIPLSKRFDSRKEDIRWQKAKAEDITSEENIEHGLDALQQLADGAEVVRGAMKRKDLAQYGGDENITFYFGKEGDASKDYKKGYGIAHIGAKHGKDAIIRAINIIANGQFERYVPGNKTVVLTDGEYETVLALTRFGNKETWLFNGWKKKENTGDNGEVSTASVSTQNSPTFSRADLGAVISAAKLLNNSETAKNNLQDVERERNAKMDEEIYRGKTLKEISNIQYAKAQEVLKALHDAGYKDFKISRSITDFGASTYIQGKYGLKFRISDHGVTSTRRMWDEVPFGLNTDTDFFVDVVKEAQEEAKKRGKELEERREKERRLDEKWDRIKPQFEGLGFKTNRRTYQSLEEFTANGKRSNVMQTPVEGGAFKYEWTEPIDEHTKEKPSYEWLERFDEGEENAMDNDVRYSLDDKKEERNGMVERAEALGAKLGTAIRVVDDVESLQHSDPKVLEKMKKAKGWYDRVSGRVTIVPGNIEDVEDAVATVMHEVVGHKGMRELVGKENYDRFLDAVYGHLTDKLKREIDERVGRTFIDGQLNEGGRSYEEVRREAVDEVIAEIAEKQPEEMSERERSLWEDAKKAISEMSGREVSDVEMKYLLWREKEWQEQVSSLKLNIGVFYKSTFEIKIIQYEQ